MSKKKRRKSGFNLSQQEFMISASLAKSAKHGYAIKKHIAENTDGQVDLSYGTLYQNINNMVDDGLIKLDSTEEHSGRLQKIYSLTDLGKDNYFGQSKIFKSFLKESEENGNK